MAPRNNDRIVRRHASSVVDQETERPYHAPTRSRTEDSQAKTAPKRRSQVFWRTETSFSDDEDSSTVESSSSVEKTVLSADELKSQSWLEDDDCSDLIVTQETYTVLKDETKGQIFVEVDTEKYMASREMTPFQERMNAITMIPMPLFCIIFVLSGNWISQQAPLMAHDRLEVSNDNDACLNWSSSPLPLQWLMGNLHAMPPLPVLAVTVGVTLHAPFSFLYHWKYASALTPAARSKHWSRRLDQSMIHVAGMFTCYGTTGNLQYFLISFLFNLDSIVRQFQPKVVPFRNQARLGVAFAAWTIPALRLDVELFLQMLLVNLVAIFLFVKYPIGGWSHSAFHLVMVLMMPLLMEAALSLPSSQDHLQQAAHCVAMAQRPLSL